MVFFDYVRTPVADWESSLSELKAQSLNQSVGIHIYWGDHESIPGVRDFHSKSRLRLEKLFKIAQSSQLPLHVRLGFTQDCRSVPNWSFSTEPKAVVPAPLGDSCLGPWEYQHLPTLRNPQVKQAFKAFVEEVGNLLSLYSQPNGPVQQVSFSLGSFETDSCELSIEDVSSYFAERYQTIEKLNHILQTSFSNFSSVASSRGLKTYLSKRCWLACWDYKALRKKMNWAWKKEVITILEEKQLPVGPFETFQNSGSGEMRIWMDDTLLEVTSELADARPLVLQGELDSSTLATFRVAEMLSLEADRKSERVGWLNFWNSSSVRKSQAVICSKFLSRATAQEIKRFIMGGGTVFFPMGLPSWDENLQALSWAEDENTKPNRTDNHNLNQLHLGQGSLLYPSTAWELKPGLYEKICEVIR